MTEERLQKILASAGVASRRACEELIREGRVTVNGHTVTEMGTKVDPNVVQIAVDGKPVKFHKRHVYLKVHKPRGVISDIGGDTRGRQTVADLLPAEMRRLFPVGRLDLNSEGLVLMTDDGDLANKLTHPRYEHPKTYYVLVSDRPPASALDQLRQGVELSDGKTAPAEVRVVPALPQGIRLSAGPTNGVWLEIILREGKKRQIRHMTAAVGFPTLRLVRWSIGPLALGDLKSGEFTPLQRNEVAALINAIHGEGRSETTVDEQVHGRSSAPTGQQGRSMPPKKMSTTLPAKRKDSRANDARPRDSRPSSRPPRTPGHR